MAGKRKRAVPRPYAGRRRAVWRRARAEKVQAVLISRPEDVGYLTGFTGHDSILALGEGWAVLLTDSRYAEQAAGQCPDVGLHVRSGPMARAVGEVLKGRRVRRVGVQGGHMTLQQARALEEAVSPKRVVALKDLTSRLREVKTDGEVAAIRRAIRVAEGAFRELLGLGRSAWLGATERELAAELEYRMRRAGADGPAFSTIVAAGAHGSQPHYHTGSARVRSGGAVLIDWGANVGGYCSDLTRVVFVGSIPPELGGVYDVVRRAQAAGIAAIRPGVACRTPDAAARAVIAAAGYGEKFGHGLGHGLGRQVHEAPGLGRTSKARLRAGMVVTVEPGIYLPGVGGVRIEDDVLVTPSGARRLTSLPRDAGAMIL